MRMWVMMLAAAIPTAVAMAPASAEARGWNDRREARADYRRDVREAERDYRRDLRRADSRRDVIEARRDYRRNLAEARHDYYRDLNRDRYRGGHGYRSGYRW
ncbi:MAG: hypothetical protein QHC65_03880 [Sphingomonas sp.]|nr:hypothetical protein [Sphingomonas sp.]MDX3883538.1 hypothetical protein [Sphingomonas sp.]